MANNEAYEAAVLQKRQELAEILICMAQRTPLLVSGATRTEDAGRHPYGVPVSIRPIDDKGFIVTLDTGMSVYLNPR